MDTFILNTFIKGTPQVVEIQPNETTDGAAYYSCIADNHMIVQLRLNEHGKWEQIWGDLSQSEINQLGSAIQNYEF